MKSSGIYLFRGTWQLDLPIVGLKRPTNVEKYFIKMKEGRGENRQSYALVFSLLVCSLFRNTEGGRDKERRENK